MIYITVFAIINDMIIEFTVGNFRSFKEPVTLSLVAESKLSSSNKSKLIKLSDGRHLLPSVGVFGANASGKSNINQALAMMHEVIVGRQKFAEPVFGYSNIEPFLLDTESRHQPLFMEIVVWNNVLNREYCYGFKVKKDQIIEEWFSIREKVSQRFIVKEIFKKEIKNSKIVFVFKNKVIGKRLAQLEKFVRPEIAAISVFNQFADELASDFVKLIHKNIITLGYFSDDKEAQDFSIKAFREDENIRATVKRIISQADLSIQDILLLEKPMPPSAVPTEVRNIIKKDFISKTKPVYRDVETVHKSYGENNDPVRFSLMKHESRGTHKLFWLAILMARVLTYGGVVIIDDLDSELHPLMVKSVIERFDNKRINPHGAQLIYNTHETFLMSDKIDIRYDQIWFTEKNRFEATELIRLSDYKIRQDYRIDRNYIAGRFGAIPDLQFEEPDEV